MAQGDTKCLAGFPRLNRWRFTFDISLDVEFKFNMFCILYNGFKRPLAVNNVFNSNLYT